MPKVTPGINNFNSGELSPLVEARYDINKYASGCRTLENALPLVEGGAKKMPGTYFIKAVKDQDKAVRLEKFSFSTVQNYVLEFGDEYIRPFTDAGAVMVPDVSSYSEFDPATEYTADDIVLVGNYVTFDFGSGKKLYISVPYDVAAYGLEIRLETNGADVLGIAYYGIRPNEGLIISLANSTSSSNSADEIQTAIRYAASVNNDRPNGFDMSAWTVTENAAYAAARPVAAPATGATQAFGSVPEGRVFKALGTSTGSFPPIETADWEECSDDLAQVALEIPTPYQEEDLFDLDLSTQSADVLFIFHSGYAPKKLCRYASDLWILEEFYILGTPDVARPGYGQIQRIISDISNEAFVKVTSPGHGFVDGDIIYINHIVGMTELNQQIFFVHADPATSIMDPDEYFLGYDESHYVDSTKFNAYLSGGWAAKLERLFNEAGEYPGCGTFFEQRMMLSGFINHPERVCGSLQGGYDDFTSDPELDDYAVQFDLVSDKVDPVLWMIGKSELILGTAGGIWVMGGSNGESLTATNVNAKKQITIGASNIHPQIVNDSIIWITRVTRIFRLLQYVWNNDQWSAPDLTRVARHITMGPNSAESGIIQTAFQQDPYPILWAVRKDGQLIGMTFESQEQVYAWFRIVTDGKFESVCVVPRENNEDRVWVVVNRNEAAS